GTPIDDSGNSLAGESESAQEGFYQTFDQTTFGVSRSFPTKVTMPDEYSGSFINSSPEETSPGIGRALGLMGINPGNIPVGTTITVEFEDGTTAQYIKQSATATYQWLWNGVAHNKAGQRIDLHGNVIGNPNTAGTGGGSVDVRGFGAAGSGWGFGLA